MAPAKVGSRAAVLEAVEQREAIARAPGRAGAGCRRPGRVRRRREGMLDFFALYLLAQFREKGLPCWLGSLLLPARSGEDHCDIITEDLRRILPPPSTATHARWSALSKATRSIGEYVPQPSVPSSSLKRTGQCPGRPWSRTSAACSRER